MRPPTRAGKFYGTSEFASTTRENGVWLPASKKSPNPDGLAVYRPLHSYEYMDAVTEALKMATTKQQAIDILHSIGRALQSGGYP
jgi:hypothetical protein